MGIKKLLKLSSSEYIILKVKHFLKYVPGFRSGEKANMVIASIYYICCLVLTITGLIFGDADKYKGISAGGGALLLPFVILNYGSLSDK